MGMASFRCFHLARRDVLRAAPVLAAAGALAGVRSGLHVVRVDVDAWDADLSDRRLRAVFQAMQRAGLGLYLHSARAAGGDPINLHVAVTQLVLGGVLDTCPRLRVIVADAEQLPPALKQMPNTYSRRFSRSPGG